jgi:hypothetical protein
VMTGAKSGGKFFKRIFAHRREFAPTQQWRLHTLE